MNAADRIRNCLMVPADFGPSRPYLRFSAVAEDRRSGEDITLEFADEGVAEVHVAHTEWREVAGRADTQVRCSALVDWGSGAARYTVGDAEVLLAALTAGPHWVRVD